MTSSIDKDLDIFWIECIPESWRVQRLKYLTRERIAGPFGSSLTKDMYVSEGYRVYGQEQVIPNDFTIGDYYISPEQFQLMRRYAVQPNDVLVSCVGTFGKIAVVPKTAKPGIINPRLILLRPDILHIVPEYFCRVLGSSGCFSQIEQLSRGGTMGVVNLSILNELKLPVPPLTVQHKIIQFLDRKTAAIDALIAKKQRLIELLEEKRSALINQAVTKGLNPDAPMKASGIPWVGHIPKHWEAKKLKFTCHLETGHTPSRTEESYWIEEECTIPWVSLNDTKTLAISDYISETKYRISPKGMANSSAHFIDSGAVVFTRDATIGLAAITTKSMAVSQHIIAWVCLPEMNNQYLLFVIYSMEQELNRLTMGSTLKTIGMADVKELRTPVPPVSEQIEIAEFIFEQKTKIQSILHKIGHQIDRLQEYRQSVITAAVTGKLDVTQALAP